MAPQDDFDGFDHLTDDAVLERFIDLTTPLQMENPIPWPTADSPGQRMLDDYLRTGLQDAYQAPLEHQLLDAWPGSILFVPVPPKRRLIRTRAAVVATLTPRLREVAVVLAVVAAFCLGMAL